MGLRRSVPCVLLVGVELLAIGAATLGSLTKEVPRSYPIVKPPPEPCCVPRGAMFSLSTTHLRDGKAVTMTGEESSEVWPSPI
jgi:hypothetical protein